MSGLLSDKGRKVRILSKIRSAPIFYKGLKAIAIPTTLSKGRDNTLTIYTE
jgi:hypothetical protein